jgi:hypothetical protein
VSLSRIFVMTLIVVTKPHYSETHLLVRGIRGAPRRFFLWLIRRGRSCVVILALERWNGLGLRDTPEFAHEFKSQKRVG